MSIKQDLQQIREKYPAVFNILERQHCPREFLLKNDSQACHNYQCKQCWKSTLEESWGDNFG